MNVINWLTVFWARGEAGPIDLEFVVPSPFAGTCVLGFVDKGIVDFLKEFMAKLPMPFFGYFVGMNFVSWDFFPALGPDICFSCKASAFKLNGSAIIHYFQSPGRG